MSSNAQALRQEIREYLTSRPSAISAISLPDLDSSEDVALKNIEGDDAMQDVERWADHGKTRSRLSKMLPYLEEPERDFVTRLLSSETRGDVVSGSQDQTAADKAATSGVGNLDGVEGRATLSQTERAMARLKTGFIEPPMFLRSQRSDEGTDDEEAELDHDRIANFFWGNMTASQALGKAHSSSSLPSSDPFQPISSPSRNNNPATLTKITGLVPISNSKMPLTPTSRRGSPESSRTLMSRAIGKAHTLAEMQCTPPAALHVSLLPPLQLRSPSPTARKRKRGTTNTLHLSASPQEFVTGATSRETLGVSFIDHHNIDNASATSLHRKNVQDEYHFDKQAPKRRRMEKVNSPGPLVYETDCVHQAQSNFNMDVLAPRKTPKTLEQWSSADLSSMATGRSLDMSTSSVMIEGGQRPTGTLQRRRIAQQLSQARPDLVNSKSPAKVDDRRSQSPIKTERTVLDLSSDFVPSSSPLLVGKESFKIPDELPLGDTQSAEDVPMDLDRSRQLAKRFRAEYAKGKRPGVVVPRLMCLESPSQ